MSGYCTEGQITKASLKYYHIHGHYNAFTVVWFMVALGRVVQRRGELHRPVQCLTRGTGGEGARMVAAPESQSLSVGRSG